jgi:protein-disulfide isomerase
LLSSRRRSPQNGSRTAAPGVDPVSSGALARPSTERIPRAKARHPTPQHRARTLLRKWALPGFIGGAVLVVAGIFAFGGGDSTSVSGVPAARPVLGNAAATVVIREYGDFQCPSCGAFARLVEPQIRATYIDTGKVRLEWHDFAWIGQESRDAANAARCAGDQGRFWDLHDLLYRSQGGENSGAFSKDRLKAFGASLGLDAAAFNACIDSGTHLGAVTADFADVSAKGFNGTPTFLIGSQRIVGAQPFSVFQAAIDAAIASK